MAEINPARNSITSAPSRNPSPLQRRSHLSVSPRMSTHSWVNSQPEAPPEGGESHHVQSSLQSQPPVSPRRGPLRMTNPDEDAYADHEEYMNIEANVPGTDMGYQVRSGKLKKDQRAKKRPFVGGFVKGLRKLSGTVFGYGGNANVRMRTPPENAELTTAHKDILPRNASNLTPVTAHINERPRRPLPSTPHPDIVDGLPPALVPGPRRPPPPSFRITPPLPVSQQSSFTHIPELPSNHPGPHVERASNTAIAMPIPAPTTQPSDNVDTPIAPRRSTSYQSHSHLERSSHPTRIEVADDQGTIGRSPSARSPGRQPSVPPIPVTPNVEPSRSHPASVLVRPLLTEDYRRMSKSITHNTLGSSSISYEPSFSTELSPIHGFFSTLWHMPWIATDRITVDYFPGMSRGAWEWKKVEVKHERHPDHENAKERTRVEYKPVTKPLKSWYTGVSPMSRGSMPSWAKSVDPEAGGIDLLSSGTSATRSSVATSNGPSSPAPRTDRKRSSHRESRRLFHSPNQYSFVDAIISTPPLRVKKKTREDYRSRNGKHSSRRYDRSRKHRRTQDTTLPPVHPIPPAAYMHGYVPYQPSTPLYFLQSPTLGPAHHPSAPVGNQAYQNQQSLLSPLIMVPGIPTVVPFQGTESIGTASPGVAGRGAGGGHVPPGTAGNFPGIFTYGGPSPVFPSASKPNPG